MQIKGFNCIYTNLDEYYFDIQLHSIYVRMEKEDL